MAKSTPVKIKFGHGNVCVMACHDERSGVEYAVAFAVQKEPHAIGEEDLSTVGKTIDEVDPAVIFEFSQPASVQVVIDKLVIIRDSLVAYENIPPEFLGFRSATNPVLIVSGKYPEPESLTPDPADTGCYCFERVGDNDTCPRHGKGQ